MSNRIEEYLAKVEKRPTDQLARYVLAKEYHDTGGHAEAVEHFRKLIEQKPDWMKCHIHLGQSLIELGKVDEARTALTEALDLAHSQNHEGPAQDIEEILKGLG